MLTTRPTLCFPSWCSGCCLFVSGGCHAAVQGAVQGGYDGRKYMF